MISLHKKKGFQEYVIKVGTFDILATTQFWAKTDEDAIAYFQEFSEKPESKGIISLEAVVVKPARFLAVIVQ